MSKKKKKTCVGQTTHLWAWSRARPPDCLSFSVHYPGGSHIFAKNQKHCYKTLLWGRGGAGLRPRTRGRGCTAAPDSRSCGERHLHLARGSRVGLGECSAPRLCASSHGLKSWKTKPGPEAAGTERGTGCICSHPNSSGVFVEKGWKWSFESQHLGGPHPGGSSPHTGGRAGIPTHPPTSPHFLAPVNSRGQRAWRGT